MTTTPVRWITSTSWELPFFGLPSEIPWPEDVDPALANANPFEMEPMLKAIESMGPEVPEPWKGFLVSAKYHDQLAEALEDRESGPALEALDEIERLQGDNAFVLFHRAHIARSGGDEEGALELYQAAAGKAPQVGPIWGNLGSLHALRGERDQASEAFKKALALNAQDQVALEGLVTLKELVKLRSADPKTPDTFHYVDLPTFRQIAEQQIANMQDADQLLGYGEQLLQDGSAPEAGLKAIERAGELRPGDPRIMLTLSAAQRHLGRGQESREMLERVTQLFPQEAVGFLQLAQTCNALHDEAGEFAALDRVLELDPNSQGALAARFRLGPNEHDPAQEDKLSAFGRDRKSWMGHLLASAIARTRGDTPAAFRHTSRAFELAPENEEVIVNHTSSLGDMKEIEQLAKVIAPAVASGKFSKRLDWTYAHVLQQLNMKNDAIRVLRQAAQEAPDEFKNMAETTLDAWSGLVTGCGVRLETHRAGFLPRPILIALADGDGGVLIAAGAPLPAEARFPWKASGDKAAVALQQGETGIGKEPLALGSFLVRDVRTGPGIKPTIDCHIVAMADGVIHFRASQAGQKLQVGWTQYQGAR